MSAAIWSQRPRIDTTRSNRTVSALPKAADPDTRTARNRSAADLEAIAATVASSTETIDDVAAGAGVGAEDLRRRLGGLRNRCGCAQILAAAQNPATHSVALRHDGCPPHSKRLADTAAKNLQSAART